jgi:hypothetical protein
MLLMLVWSLCLPAIVSRSMFTRKWLLQNFNRDPNSLISGDEGYGNMNHLQLIFKYDDSIWNTYLNETILDTLQVLDLSHSCVAADELRRLASKLTKMKRLTVLILDGCKLSADDLRTLTHSLRKVESLRCVSLSRCGLNDDSIESLRFLAKANRNLTAWDLSQNSITAESIIPLSKMLMHGGALRMLDLSYNLLRDSGLLMITDMLNKSYLPELQYLAIKQIGASSKACVRLLEVMALSPALSMLDLSGNRLVGLEEEKTTVKGLLAKYTNSKLLPGSLSLAISSLSASWQPRNQKGLASTRAKPSSKSAKSKTQKNKAKTFFVPKKRQDPRLLLSRALFNTLQRSTVRSIGLAKTGLDSKFFSIWNNLDHSGHVTAEVDVRLNDLSEEEMKMIGKQHATS